MKGEKAHLLYIAKLVPRKGEGMKKGVKIVLIVLAMLLVVIVALLAVFGWYLPHYWADNTVYDASQAPQQQQITVMSFNIRYYTPGDMFKKSWFYRAPLIIKTIADVQPDVIGFQEVTQIHERYLRAHLQGYQFVVAYRNQSVLREGVMLAYRADRFEELTQGMFWISETPEVESKDWGSAFPRVAVYATLRDKVSGKSFTALDTHLDHISEEARGEGMRVLCEQGAARGWQDTIMMGDMNDYVGTLQYTYATTHGFVDALSVAANKYEGTGATYQGFGKYPDNARIDYFYLSPTFAVQDYRVVDTLFDGVYASDHFGIVIKTTLHQE